MKLCKPIVFFLTIQLSILGGVKAQVKILFDASKAQMAGNADWVIDANLHNIGTNSSGVMVVGLGDEANPQRVPAPAQSTVTASTPETYWNGSLSSWGIALVKLGYEVETLPYNDSITFGNTTHAQDLSNYKVFIVDEPNIRFKLSERNAIVQFVQNGGGLFMISDHTISDRNNDGWDSPQIWNDIMTTNTVHINPFGITCDYQNFSETTSNFNSLPTDSVLHGSQGNPTQMKYSNGTTFTLSPTDNTTVVGLVYKTGSSHGNTNVFMARCHYGSGKVVALGDSSPPDDGTGDPNDALYSSWSGEANGDHARILLNATIWLASSSSSTGVNSPVDEINFSVFPNPTSGLINVHSDIKNFLSAVTIVDMTGRLIRSQIIHSSQHDFTIQINESEAGIYFLCLKNKERSIIKKIVKF